MKEEVEKNKTKTKMEKKKKMIIRHGKRDAGKTFGAMTLLETGPHLLVRSYSITKNKETKNWLGNFFYN